MTELAALCSGVVTIDPTTWWCHSVRMAISAFGVMMGSLAKATMRFPGHAISRNASSYVLAGLTVVLFAWLVTSHDIYIRAYPQDALGLLDGIHRMVQGQAPHRDFSTIIGAAYYGLPALFVHSGADPVSAIGYSAAALLLLNAAIVRHLLATRLTGRLGLLFVVWSVLALTARLNFGEDAQFVTLAMGYNRYCTVFLCELLLLFIPPVVISRRVAVQDALIMGVILDLLFYSKITFGLCGLAALVLLVVYRPRELGSVVGALIVFGLTAVAVEWAFHLHLALASDIWMAIKASSSSPRSGWLANEVVLNLPELLACVALPAVVLLRSGLLTLRLALLFGFVTAASLMLLNNSAQIRIFSLPFALLLVTADMLTRAMAQGTPVSRMRLARRFLLIEVVTLTVGLLYSYPLAVNIGIASARTFGGSHADLGSAFGGRLLIEGRGPDLHGEISLGDGELTALDLLGRGLDDGRINQPDRLGGRMYAATLRDGMAAVDRACGAGAHVLTADFVNPFPALLNLPVAGGIVFMHPGLLISQALYVTPERLMAGIDCVMVPKLPTMPLALTFFNNVYGPYVAARFEVAAQTEYWTVLRSR